MMRRLRLWWRRPEPAPADESLSPEFAHSCASVLLDGCADSQGQMLRLRMSEVRSRLDLLHLRPLIYDCVARRFGEHEAQRRLALPEVLLPAAPHTSPAASMSFRCWRNP